MADLKFAFLSFIFQASSAYATGTGLPYLQAVDVVSGADAVGKRAAAAGAKWWTRVGDKIYHEPSKASQLSPNIEDYYYAVGSKAALTDELQSHRVGGEGRFHIFHLPKGPAMLQRTLHHSADRRSSLSKFKQLSHASSLSADFPVYSGKSTYVNPLSSFGQDIEKEAVAGITKEMYLEYLEKITSLETRSYASTSGTSSAIKLLKGQFDSMGLKVCTHEYSGIMKGANVIGVVSGTKPGSVVIGAHYDSRPFDGRAPGAEDNGSGVAGMLAMAYAFQKAKVKPEKTVIFVGFAGEEPGLVGSEMFAQEMASGGRQIREACGLPDGSFAEKDLIAAIIMDEIGWLSPAMNDTVNMETYDSAENTMEHLAHACHDHNGDKLRIVHSNNPFGSDHMSFLDHGIEAVLTINGDDEAYPDYHQSSDTIDHVSPQYASRIAKMNLGAAIRMAGVLKPTSASKASSAPHHHHQRRKRRSDFLKPDA